MDSLTTFGAKYLILLPVLVTAYLIYKTTKKRELIKLLVVGGILSIILAKIVGKLYWDPRPFISDGAKALVKSSTDNGFPSDHTLLAAFLGFVALGYSKKLGWMLLVVAALIGCARVAAHVHHAPDIIGSFVITGLAYVITIKLLDVKKRPANKKTDSKEN